MDPGEPPTVRLVDAGRGTGRVLAHLPSRGESEAAVTVSGTRSTSVAGAAPRRDDTPEQTLTLRGESQPDVDGAVRQTVHATGFTSTDDSRSAQFATAAGFGVTWVRAADGTVRSAALEAPGRATDAARAGVETTTADLDAAAVVFPHEPVAAGARWEVTRRVADGVAPTRVDAYELTALDGDVATLRVRTTAPVESRTLRGPAPDGGATVALDVRTYEAGGEATWTVDLRAPLPRSGRSTQTTKAVYVDPGTGTQTTFDSSRTLTITSR